MQVTTTRTRKSGGWLLLLAVASAACSDSIPSGLDANEELTRRQPVISRSALGRPWVAFEPLSHSIGIRLVQNSVRAATSSGAVTIRLFDGQRRMLLSTIAKIAGDTVDLSEIRYPRWRDSIVVRVEDESGLADSVVIHTAMSAGAHLAPQAAVIQVSATQAIGLPSLSVVDGTSSMPVDDPVWSIADPSIVEVHDRELRAKRSGTTLLRAQIGALQWQSTIVSRDPNSELLINSVTNLQRLRVGDHANLTLAPSERARDSTGVAVLEITGRNLTVTDVIGSASVRCTSVMLKDGITRVVVLPLTKSAPLWCRVVVRAVEVLPGAQSLEIRPVQMLLQSGKSFGTAFSSSSLVIAP